MRLSTIAKRALMAKVHANHDRWISWRQWPTAVLIKTLLDQIPSSVNEHWLKASQVLDTIASQSLGRGSKLGNRRLFWVMGSQICRSMRTQRLYQWVMKWLRNWTTSWRAIDVEPAVVNEWREHSCELLASRCDRHEIHKGLEWLRKKRIVCSKWTCSKSRCSQGIKPNEKSVKCYIRQ